MYWYDILLMVDTYNEMMEDSKNDSDNNILDKQQEMTNNFSPSSINIPKFNMPSIPNIGTISSGLKF